MKPVRRSQLIWVRIPSGTTAGRSIPFPDQPDLKGVLVTAILALDDSFQTFTPDNIPVIAAASSPYYTVTLNDGSDMRHKQIPIRQLATFYNAGIWTETEPFVMDWQKSRVTFQGAVALAADAAVPFIVHYYYPETARRQA